MSAEKKEINITPPKGTTTLVIREGKARELFEKAPEKVRISGILDSPKRWLEKRVALIDQKQSNLVVDRDKMEITLEVNEIDFYGARIIGSLELHPKFNKFSINKGVYLTTFQMSDLIKMNRSYFENPQTAMELVSALKSFTANIEKKLEKSTNDRGNKKEAVDQVVSSNIPEKWNMKIPIFKGSAPEVFEVEVYIEPDHFTCTLISPAANDLVERIRDEAIDNELTAIALIAPELVIIEQ